MLGEAHDGVQGAGCSSGEMLGEVHDGVRGGCRAAQSRVKSGVQGGRRSGRRCGVKWDWKRQKWRAKSLRTPFYQYSIYNQKDVLIIRLKYHLTSLTQRTLPSAVFGLMVNFIPGSITNPRLLLVLTPLDLYIAVNVELLLKFAV